MNLTDINDIRALLSRHGFRFSKALGQNFLCADWVPAETAVAAGLDDGTGVLEVGPGVGCLTAALARRAKRVVSIELDERLRPVLAETLAGFGNAEVVFADVMKTDLAALCAEKFSDCRRVVLCANLPYQITTPALTAFVRAGCFETMTVMIQREVARAHLRGGRTPQITARSPC
jgi:16S rRNA (adenine1518-N6/adenine1519-N6)-dimethyltransferase